MGPAPAVRRAEPIHDDLCPRQIHDGLMSPAFGVPPAVINQNPPRPGDGGKITAVPVLLFSLTAMEGDPMSQPPSDTLPYI